MGQTGELDWKRVRTIFEDALLRPPDERRHYAKEVCGGDAALWVEVSSLLDSHDGTDGFLESPAVVHVVETSHTNENQLVAGQRLLHYEIQDLIGSGGMGEVYLARDTRLGRNVAVKLLRQDLLPHFRASERLLREARAAALLEHPNICQIHEISEVDGCSFIVMQYVVGTTLDEILSGSAPKAATALDIAAQVAEGLAEAHRRGIVHRDIKPANIIVSDKGHVKILDFGLAKFLEAESSADAVSRMESTGGVMGTVPYMSPEQLLGNAVDARTDVFSFGAMLFEMLCGVSAFGRETNADTISAILNDEPDWSLLPVSVRPVLEKCLAKDPSSRFGSANEVTEVLKTARESVNGSGQKRSPITGSQRVNAVTEAAEPLTEPLYGWQSQGKNLSVPVPRTSRIGRRRFGSYGVLAVLLAVSSYGGYILYKRYSSGQTAAAPITARQLIPFRKGDKFGFCDENKKLVIEAKYDDAQPFSEGFAVVNIGRKGNPGESDFALGKTGVIDQTGREVVPPKYDSIIDYTNSLAIVRIDVVPDRPLSGKYGVINKSGREVVPPQYDWIGRFVEGLAPAVLDGKLGYIDERGTVAIPFVYDATSEGRSVGDFSGGLAAVSVRGEGEASNGKYGYIDRTGRNVIPFQFDHAMPFRIEDPNGMYLAAVTVDKKCGYIDLQGSYKIARRFTSCGNFSEGLAAVGIDDRFAFIDTTGKIVIPPRPYTAAGEFHEDRAPVVTLVSGSQRTSYINRYGDEMVQPKYRSIGSWDFQDGLAHVCRDGGEGSGSVPDVKTKCGFIDRNGSEVISLKYDLGSYFFNILSNDLIRVKLDGRSFYIDRNGVEYYDPSQETVTSARACKFDPALDFSTTVNPSGSWTFGYTAVLSGPFVLYDSTKVNEHINYWYRSDHPNAPLPPEVGYNPGAAFTQPGDATWTAMGFHLHPGPDGTLSVARWTAVTSGTYDVRAMFSLADNGATDVHVLHNSVKLFDDVLDGRDDSRSFNAVVSVTAGDTIDFVVGPAGDYFNDSTALIATISDRSCGS